MAWPGSGGLALAADGLSVRMIRCVLWPLRGLSVSIDRLSAEDQLMVWASSVWPQEIGALAILDGTCLFDAADRFRIDDVRAVIRSRLDQVPRFRQRIEVPGRGRGAPLWVDVRHFDVRDHVRVLPLSANADEAELLLAVERLRGRRLDPSRPPWEMWFITGSSDRRVALYLKLDHAMADGLAALSMVAAFLDAMPDAPAVAPRPWRPASRPSTRALLADVLRRRADALVGASAMLVRPLTTIREAMAAWPAAREILAEERSPETSLDRMVGAERSIALVRGRSALVREIAHAHDATTNDVLLALTAGGLRALLQGRADPVDDLAVKVYVPVSLRRRLRGSIRGNRFSQMVVPLTLAGTDPSRRLRQIAEETAVRKARARPSLGTLFRGRIARKLMLAAVARRRVNVTTACIPGPKRPRYLAGARMLEVFPVLPLIGNVALGVGVVSYGGAFCIGITADQDAYPDLDVFTEGVRADLRALTRNSRQSVVTSAVSTVGDRVMPVHAGVRAMP
jgi:WS/DGAT/MGAT family acyltransferase